MEIEAFLLWIVEEYGYIGVFIASFIGNASILFPLPVIFFVYTTAPYFNPFLLSIVASMGATLGEGTGYVLGYGVDYEVHIDKTRFNKQYISAKKLFKKHGPLTITLFAATPLPDDIIGLICGAIRYPVLSFLFYCFIGKLIMHLFVIFTGFYSFTAVNELFKGYGVIGNLAVLLFILILTTIISKKIGWRNLIRKVIRMIR